jgi:hypothetical protein
MMMIMIIIIVITIIHYKHYILDIGNTVEHNKNYLLLLTQYYYLLYNATSFDSTMGPDDDPIVGSKLVALYNK